MQNAKMEEYKSWPVAIPQFCNLHFEVTFAFFFLSLSALRMAECCFPFGQNLILNEVDLQTIKKIYHGVARRRRTEEQKQSL